MVHRAEVYMGEVENHASAGADAADRRGSGTDGVGGGCRSGGVRGSPGRRGRGTPRGPAGAPPVVAPPVQASMPPKSPNVVPGAAFDGLPARIEQATQDAAAN